MLEFRQKYDLSYSEPLNVESRNKEHLRLHRYEFAESEGVEGYLFNFDQYPLYREISRLFGNCPPEEVKKHLDPRKIHHFPTADLDKWIQDKACPKGTFALRLEKVKRLIKKPLNLDTLPKVHFFQDYLVVNAKQLKEIERAIGKGHSLSVPSLLADQKQTIGPFYRKIERKEPVITKTGTEGTRHLGIYRLLAHLGLEGRVIPSNGSDELLAMPKRSLSSIRSQPLTETMKEDLAWIAVIHLLLYAHDGDSANVKIQDNERAVCLDLGRSLVPRKVYLAPNPKNIMLRVHILTLNTLFLRKNYRDLPIPITLQEHLKSEAFLENLNSLQLVSFIPRTDPLRKEPKLLREAETALKERGHLLHQLAQEKETLTVNTLLEAVYPDEMAMIELAPSPIRVIIDCYQKEKTEIVERLQSSAINILDYDKLCR